MCACRAPLLLGCDETLAASLHTAPESTPLVDLLFRSSLALHLFYVLVFINHTTDHGLGASGVNNCVHKLATHHWLILPTIAAHFARLGFEVQRADAWSRAELARLLWLTRVMLALGATFFTLAPDALVRANARAATFFTLVAPALVRTNAPAATIFTFAAPAIVFANAGPATFFTIPALALVLAEAAAATFFTLAPDAIVFADAGPATDAA